MLLNIVSHPIRSMMCPEIGLTKIWGEEIFKLDLVQHKFLSEKYSLQNLKPLSTWTIDVKISQLSHASSIYILCNHVLTNSISFNLSNSIVLCLRLKQTVLMVLRKHIFLEINQSLRITVSKNENNFLSFLEPQTKQTKTKKIFIFVTL